MSNLKQFITRSSMVTFIILTYLISWALVIPTGGSLLPYGPMIAAFIVLALASGRPGVADLWQRMIRWRVDGKWYLIAPGIFIVINLVGLALNLLLGAQITSTAHFQPGAYLGILLSLVLAGGWWEEPGWTGYALRYFQDRLPHSQLIASAATGLLRMIWHTPLLLYGIIPWYDYLFYSFALQFILTWLYNRTGGSVLVPMLGHLASNVMFATVYPLFTGAEQVQFRVFMIAAAWVIVLGILIATRGSLGLRPSQKPAPALST